MDVLKTVSLASDSCSLALREGIYLFRSRLIPSISLSSWEKFLASLKSKRSTLGSLCEQNMVWGLGHRVTAATAPLVVVRSAPLVIAVVPVKCFGISIPNSPHCSVASLQSLVPGGVDRFGCMFVSSFF